MNTASSIRAGLLGAVSALAISVSSPMAQEAFQTIDIAPQPLATALVAFSEQTDIVVVAPGALVEGKTASRVSGDLPPDEALEQLLEGTGLSYSRGLEGEITIVQSTALRSSTQLAQADVGTATDGMTTQDEQDERHQLKRDEIIVTGTNIRGIAPESSPVRTFDREDIQISGVSTAQDFIQLLPQNFGGGANADLVAGVPNDVNSGFNGVSQGGSLGSSVNLRGLGSGSTLVLLNGHRLAPSSGIGDFVDISMIPASAIERIDVLTDGASSIYGADAVAGVVNFVLRDDFDGVEASLRYGTATEGDLDEYRTSVTAGKNWASGNALVVYEYFKQDNLSAADRSFSQGALLPNDLLPSQERHSILASISQELSSDFEVFSDLTFSSRRAEQANTSGINADISRATPNSQNFNISWGGSWNFLDTWYFDFSGTYSDVHSESNLSGDNNIKREINSRIWVGDVKASGDLFDMPGGFVKLAIGGHLRSEAFENIDVLTNQIDREAERDIYALFGEIFVPLVGPDNMLPGIDRLELNISGRFEDYSDFGSTADPKVGVLWSPVETLRFRGSFSTSFNPPALGRVGATDAIANVAPTSFWNGILGLTPGDPSIEDVPVITVFGTSSNLRAENSRAFTAGFDFDEQWGRHDLTLAVTYFDIEFENRLGATPVPDGRRIFDAPNIAFNNPKLFPPGSIIFSPTTEQINELVGNLDTPILIFPGTDPFAAEIINFVPVVRNLSRTSVSGLDFDASYSIKSNVGNFTAGLDGTFLKKFEQQAAFTTPLTDQVDTLFNPVSLRLRARAGYSHNGFAANVFVNHANSYSVDNTATSEQIEAWTTVDLSMSYSMAAGSTDFPLNNTVFRLSVLNLFDENPPSTPSTPEFGIFGFDPTNSTPLNRFIAFGITTRF